MSLQRRTFARTGIFLDQFPHRRDLFRDCFRLQPAQPSPASPRVAIRGVLSLATARSRLTFLQEPSSFLRCNPAPPRPLPPTVRDKPRPVTVNGEEAIEAATDPSTGGSATRQPLHQGKETPVTRWPGNSPDVAGNLESQRPRDRPPGRSSDAAPTQPWLALLWRTVSRPSGEFRPGRLNPWEHSAWTDTCSRSQSIITVVVDSWKVWPSASVPVILIGTDFARRVLRRFSAPGSPDRWDSLTNVLRGNFNVSTPVYHELLQLAALCEKVKASGFLCTFASASCFRLK